MNFRSTEDLNREIIRGIPSLPRDIDLVVGIPRSGLLAATLMALHRNLPLTDLDGLIEGRLHSYGHRLAARVDGDLLGRVRKVLVVDDSANSGATLQKARERLAEARLPYDILFAAVYVTESSRAMTDYYFAVVPTPRLFAWNLMHHPNLERCCVDIDGVLCRDPTPEENDDGPRYERFLEMAESVFVPTETAGWIVSSRLEKYRPQTEAWLSRNNIRYRELVMLDLPNKAERQKAQAHAPFKAGAYARTNALLFIESEAHQAIEIADLSGRPVLCMTSQRIVYPSSVGTNAALVARRGARSLRSRAHSAVQRILDRLLHRSRVEL